MDIIENTSFKGEEFRMRKTDRKPSGSFTVEKVVDRVTGALNPLSVVNVKYGTGEVAHEASMVIKKAIIFNVYVEIGNERNNMTSSDTAICRNPGVTKESYASNIYYVFYERQKTNGQFAIYFRKATSITPYNWTVPDTLANLGNNRNVRTISSFPISASFSFESDRTGKWGIYQTYWNPYYSKFEQSMIAQSNSSENRNLVTFLYPLIAGRATAQLASFVNQANDSTRIFSGVGGLPFTTTNTITIGDTTKKPVLTMSNGIPTIPYGLFRVWLVYNKDSAGYSMLYAKGKKMAIIGSIRIIE
ncbi:hypothetical protein HGB07_08510, partial [Candidatus Roizmanbacteria bacterium]|nr:hypothetical protein [Candidatus Roizmanbacteria bacterium]